MPEPQASSALSEQSELSSLRERVLTSFMTYFAIAAPVLTVVSVLQALAEGVLTPLLLACWLFACLLVPLRLLHARLGFGRSARLFTAHLALTSAGFLLLRGLTPGIALLQVALILWCALLFDLRGVLWALAYSSTVLVLSGFAASASRVGPWDDSLWDPRSPIVWLRYLLVLLLVGGALATTIVKLLDALEQKAAMLEQALRRERES